jgi:hypothetical protein
MQSSKLPRYKRILGLVGLMIVAGALVSCATQPIPTAHEPPGFWLGLFHGLTMFFSLIGSIFTDYRVYAFPNAGGWYDFGFVFGAACAFGGSGAAAR